jgi:hypothetical protein
MANNSIILCRSRVTGKFVTREYARRHKRTTLRNRLQRRGYMRHQGRAGVVDNQKCPAKVSAGHSSEGKAITA